MLKLAQIADLKNLELNRSLLVWGGGETNFQGGLYVTQYNLIHQLPEA